MSISLSRYVHRTRLIDRLIRVIIFTGQMTAFKAGIWPVKIITLINWEINLVLLSVFYRIEQRAGYAITAMTNAARNICVDKNTFCVCADC